MPASFLGGRERARLFLRLRKGEEDLNFAHVIVKPGSCYICNANCDTCELLERWCEY